MDSPITFTPANIIAFILSFSVFITSIGGAVSLIAKVVSKTKAPEEKQNARIKDCEKRLDDLDVIIKEYRNYFTNDDKRLKRIEESNRVMQKGMLALLKHSINGNEIEPMKQAEKELESYLISKD